MAESLNKRCALDVNFLLDLAERRDFALAFLELAGEYYCPLCLCPTAFIELEYLAKTGAPKQKKAAAISVNSLHKWAVYVFDLTPVEHGCTKEFARRLIRKGYLDEEEYNDGLILGEAGCFGIPILVTSDSHLLDIPQNVVTAELRAADFFPTVVASPQKIVRIARRNWL